ncbi:hypothetical protein HID58_093445 [Brassica napus]|uniref:Uncharacterized protein n=1 Tax=Brassica napus TaxID=3708 RepID=A0ABQ7WXJ9_BRANA|nr:hypothetical protein HID58_092105 [Brassica napus]KAH0853125.1 hypothetical protein HID58_093445 [Brassica napus]
MTGRYCLEWWIKLLSAHGIDNYARVMYVMEQREVVEAIVTLLLNDERGSIIPLSFLFGMIMDAYLAEIARDPYLSLQKFTAIIESNTNHISTEVHVPITGRTIADGSD